ncbi:hypothetical protein [Providencia rettgeri]|nr:hypothetical protein [Providencia rettgeri]
MTLLSDVGIGLGNPPMLNTEFKLQSLGLLVTYWSIDSAFFAAQGTSS